MNSPQRISFLFIYLFALTGSGYAQNKSEIKNLTSSNPDSAISYLKPFLNHTNDSVKATSSQLIGNSYYYKSYYDSAITFYKKSNEYLDSTNTEQLLVIAKNYNNIGVCLNFLAKAEAAYSYHHKTLKIREALDDPAITSTYNNLGLILEDLGDYDGALAYYKKAYLSKIAKGQFRRLSTTTRNIAGVFTLTNQLDSASEYLNRNLAHLDSIPNKRELAFTYTALGNVHELLEEFDKSFAFSKKGFSLKKELKDYEGLMNSALNIGVVLRELEEYKMAELYLDSLEVLVPDFRDRPMIVKYYIGRAHNNYAIGNYKAAYNFYLKGDLLADSLSESQNREVLYELEEKYQSEQKEAEINQLTAENEIQRLQAREAEQTKLILIIVSIALIVIAFLFYSRFKSKAKSNALLNAKNDELAKLNQTKDRLFSIISHDLKSPLSSFHTITKSLTDNWEQLEKEQLKSFIESLRDSSANVRDMMDNLLKWALAQTDQLEYKAEIVDASGILSKVQQQLKSVSDVKRIRWKTDIKSQHKVLADSQFIEIVIRNIMSNALKFSEMESEVAIAVEEVNSKQVITISDHGVGMEQSEIDKLVKGEILAQDIRNSPEKGTGLGLTLCTELMSKMKAQMEITSAKNKGTTFKLIFEQAA